MSTASSWIESAISEHGLAVVTLSTDDAKKLLDEIRRLYCQSDLNLPLWEAVQECASRRRDTGWQDIEQFVGSHKCVLLLQEGPNAYECMNGNALTRLLEECPGFEFYVTDAERTYLLCLNHHDYLIGCGSAIDWVNSLVDEM